MLLKLCCSLFKIGDIRLKYGLQHCTNTDTLLRRQLLRIEKNINFWIMLYLLVSLCIIIGQFSRSYFTVPLTKFKHLKCSPSIWTQRYNENLSNLLMLGGIISYWTLFFPLGFIACTWARNTSGKNMVCDLQYRPGTWLVRGFSIFTSDSQNWEVRGSHPLNCLSPPSPHYFDQDALIGLQALHHKVVLMLFWTTHWQTTYQSLLCSRCLIIMQSLLWLVESHSH